LLGVHMAPAILVLLSVLSLHPAARRDSSVQKTWTNDDIDSLRVNAPISVFNPSGMIQIIAVPVKANTPVAVKPPYVKELDADWYTTEITSLQTEIAASNSVVQRIEDIRRSGVGISNVIPLDREDVGLTPESTIQILQAQSKELTAKMDDLQELARRNHIPPGEIR
jgi:hypothetical protein